MDASDGDHLSELRRALLGGLVIPAHPLALTAERRLDERRQVALTRYYCDAGAGGIAVGVHTTQFAIRDPAVHLLQPVLELARCTVRDWSSDPQPITIAGVCGLTAQAVREAELAASLDYDAALVSLAALRSQDNARLLDHCRRVADVIPVMGFYLQPAVGGRVLDRPFWREFLDIERIVAIKVAPFDRYRTLDVVAVLAESGRRDVALYTGNDDAIVSDLLTPFPGFGAHDAPATLRQAQRRPDRIRGARERPPSRRRRSGEPRRSVGGGGSGSEGSTEKTEPGCGAESHGGCPLHFCGGLLGQWAVWTNRAVDLLRCCRAITSPTSQSVGATSSISYASGEASSATAERRGTEVLRLLALGAELTDANAALFDPAHQFAGCIPGIHEVLRRQGLLAGRWCLDPQEELSPGQMEEIDRVLNKYPHLTDDAFVCEHLDGWLK
jgi:dihydrodipicolinate synthase/N-acetylneuraminate lyase